MTIFVELSLIIFIATAVSIVMRLLKQPLIVGYILTGILVGPYVFDVLQSSEELELFSKIGISILLFIVGLHLSPKVIKEVGGVSLLTGLGQIAFTAIVGYLTAIAFGIDKTAAIFVALGLTFSSTIIILKLLSDKGDLNKLYGKIAIGFLLVQDIVAMIALVVVSTMAQTAGEEIYSLVGLILLKGALSIVALYFLTRKVLVPLSTFFASSQELLFIFSLAWGLGLASFFYALGFSIEIGALAAGVTLSITPFAAEIGSRLKPLRDFFLLIFFIFLGSQMIFESFSSLLLPALAFSVIILIGNPLIVMLIMNLLGYRRNTGFMAGLTVAQIGEFSLILMTLALVVGSVSAELLSMITLVSLFTIAGSTYLVLYSEKVYPRMKKYLGYIALRKNFKAQRSDGSGNYEVALFGHDRVGIDFVKSFEELGAKYFVVDINPKTIDHLIKQNTPCLYGDAGDIEFLEELELQKLKLVVSTVPDKEANLLLVKKYKELNPDGIIMVISHDLEEAHHLYEVGATYVIMPHHLGASMAAQMISKNGLDVRKFNRAGAKHRAYIEQRELLLAVS